VSDKATQSRPDRQDPKGGTIIADRYQVDRLVARGGMAAVYLAHHVKLNRPVALKILAPPPDAEDPESFEDRFRLEAETLAALDHPNIVILHDFGETSDGRFFLAMEYVEGPRLSDLLKDGPLPVERALGLIMQVCSGLRYAHKRGVVHRDLKPSNMLVRTKDNGEELVKVVDFGLVKLKETDQSITRAGLILGSPHCMAPEQIKGLDVDARADIYAVGILMFRTLTGQYPFHGPNSAATMIAHLNQPVPTFFSVAPELVAPAGLEEIVRKCLEKNAPDRYDDMNGLMTDLAKVMNVPPEQFRTVSQTNSTISKSMVTVVPGGHRTGLVAAAAIGGVVLTLLIVGGIAVAMNVGNVRGAQPTTDITAVAPPPVAPPPPVVVAPPAPPVVETPPAPPVVPVVETPPEPPPVAKATKPKPKPKTPPKPPGTTTTATTPPTTTPEKDPEGYMGLPDDFK
jgi:hypothetical protein